MNENSKQKKIFYVTGMMCAGCAATVENTVAGQKGVEEARVNFAASTIMVDYDAAEVTPADLQQAVRAAGYDLLIDDEDKVEDIQQKEFCQLKRNTLGSVVLSLPVFIIGMFFMHMPYGDWIMLVFTLPVVLIFGRSFFINAWLQLKHGRASMDTLVAVSTGIAFLFSLFNTFYPEYWTNRGLEAHVYYEASSVIIALILLGRLLESRAKNKTSSAIRKLMGLQPKMVVRVSEDGSEHEIPVKAVQFGDVLLVKPGGRIPVDGTVKEGISYVDESMITGESLPVEKVSGMKVYAGTMNQKGSFRFVAERVGSETVLAHIVKMVQEAQGSKAPVQRLVDKIAGIFVPVVIGIAVFTFVVWMIVGGELAFTHALLTSITVLVIACPCALGLATPTAIMVGIGKGAEYNILIKDAESLELLYKTTAVVLDKTGTITEGHPVVTGVLWKEGVDVDRLAPILMALESKSEHPLADAVVAYLSSKGIKGALSGTFESITGLGIKGSVEGREFWVGNKRLMEGNTLVFAPEQLEKADAYRREGNTVVYFAGGGQILAVIAIADQIKKGSACAVIKLRKAGIKVYMLTGDNEVTARAVAEQVGLKEYRSEMMPSDKALFVKELQSKGEVVAMVGDGINDSQALAQADVSIAMGRGSDIAMDVSKITLIRSDLNAIPDALKLSRRTVRTIRQNLFWAFIYNVIGIPLAAGVLYPCCGFLLNPMIAAAAMAFSSVSVVTNSLRLKAGRMV
ncbi:MAG: heavy metal translocating P-type ATPase [Odoribacter sp.]|nr:heavy metal translocating P-type ATPase [Odoribacter sp.]